MKSWASVRERGSAARDRKGRGVRSPERPSRSKGKGVIEERALEPSTGAGEGPLGFGRDFYLCGV